MIATITAFKASPDEGQGMARDMRVRWALEEVGQPYEVQLVTFEEMRKPAYRALQPFGQIPAYREGDLVLFESGAIILHLAQTHAGLLPTAPNARGRAIAWMFAALNTLEPPIVEREQAEFTDGDKPWHGERVPMMEDRIRVRLGQLAARLGNADWLDGEFSAGDLMVVMVLRRVDTWLLAEFPTLAAYVRRGAARPAYQRAFAAQLEVARRAKEE